MKVGIINHFSPRVCDYLEIEELEKSKYEIEMYTKKRHKSYYESSHLKSFFYDNIVNDKSYLMDIIESNTKKPFDIIVATHEFDIVLAAKLRKMFGISGQTVESATCFRDKYHMKKNLEGHIDLPNFSKITDVSDLIHFSNENRYPLVVKPRNGAGSMGVSILENNEDLKKFIGQEISSDLMVESFVEGEMYHIDGLYKENSIIVSTVSKYFNDCLSFNKNIPLGSYLVDEDNEIYDKLTKSTLDVLNIIKTPKYLIPFHAEFFVKDNKVTFCEIASRVGGGLINDAFKLVKNIDLQKIFVERQIGIENLEMKNSEKRTAWITIPPKEGELLSVKLLEKEWIEKVKFDESSIGRTYNGGDFSGSALISYLIVGIDEKDLKEKIIEVIEWQDKNVEYNHSIDSD